MKKINLKKILKQQLGVEGYPSFKLMAGDHNTDSPKGIPIEEQKRMMESKYPKEEQFTGDFIIDEQGGVVNPTKDEKTGNLSKDFCNHESIMPKESIDYINRCFDRISSKEVPWEKPCNLKPEFPDCEFCHNGKASIATDTPGEFFVCPQCGRKLEKV